jgi:hypothetical protein
MGPTTAGTKETREPTATGELVAGRYRIEARLAQGGMGKVYRAFDTVDERSVALKRLIPGKDARRAGRMFEREFHTLAGLKHPRIIAVYDYGVDAAGPYYTMELLDGADLRTMSGLPYRQACRYLRDVASSLALLHARRLLHRDLSPRNVRVTSDDRAKLLDFGALTAFGRTTTLVGTPPCVPPEAVSSGMLDQRGDIFSLGALAYWLLSGKHAYPARTLQELPEVWKQTPPPPSEALSGTVGVRSTAIPLELDELVVSMLSPNPLARPASAAEVIARLSAIAELPPDEEPLSALSYLAGGKLIGRGRERAQLRKRLKAALAGSGSTVLLESPDGMGAGQILEELAVEAQLAGASALSLDAALHRRPLGLAEALVQAAFDANPKLAERAALPHSSQLARLQPGSLGQVSTLRMSAISEGADADPRESRLRMQAGVLGWLDDFATESPLLIAVRTFHRADEGSAGLLAALTDGITKRRILLVLAHDPDEPSVAPGVIANLRQHATRVRLSGLRGEEVSLLVESVFGKVQQVERLADWLYRLTGGKPRDCMELMRHLVENGAITFAEGVWALPQELHDDELPSGLGPVLSQRIQRLPAAAQKLLAALAITRGSTPTERVLEIARLEGIGAPYDAIGALFSAQIIRETGDAYHLAHEAWNKAALEGLEPAELQRLHAQLGDLISASAGEASDQLLDAGWHLLHGGHELQGARLLERAGLAMSLDGNELSAAVPALEAALEVYRKHGRPKHELINILAPLSQAGFYANRSVVERHGDVTVDTMREVLKLDLADRLRPALGRHLSLFVALGLGGAGYFLRRGFKGIAEYRATVVLFSSVVVIMTGLTAITLDPARARRYPKLLEPLTALGRNSAGAVAHEFVCGLALISEERMAAALGFLRGALERLTSNQPIRDLSPGLRTLLTGTAQYAVGSIEAFHESKCALDLADQLESGKMRLFELFAHQVRMAYYALRGEVETAERFRLRVEAHAVQAGSGWQAETWAPPMMILAYELTQDVIGVKRVMGELERLATDVPSLRDKVELAKASYHKLRGDHATSKHHGYPIWSNAEPRGYTGWTATLAGEVLNLSKLGQTEEAYKVGLWALSYFDAADMQVTSMMVPLIVEVAKVQLERGDHVGAAQRVDNYLKLVDERLGPTTRGTLHEVRARIAHRAGNQLEALEHYARMERCFRPTANPALIARCERLARKLGQRGTAADLAELGAQDAGPATVRTELRRCAGKQERLDRVLGMLIEQTCGQGGYLFLCGADGDLALVSPQNGEEPPDALLQRIEQDLHQYRNEDEVTLATGSAVGGDSAFQTMRQVRDRHRTFLITTETDGKAVAVGAVAIELGRRALRVPGAALLSALADSLIESGDVAR